MNFPRASGILFASDLAARRFGIGDLGGEAFKFVDFLVEAEQTYWQILPLAPVGQGNSPYSAYSAFAGNTLLISPESLVTDGLVTAADIDNSPKFSAVKVDFREGRRMETNNPLKGV
ncbi:MAG: 4-alpha-glucanotransferase [Acidobacteria bacterium]|nr:4-alpha-glucanotransferase [Acidobacteriota bacterium]